ncbi:ABC transporter permease [Rhodovulum sp. DZ06]|uniref:ABC transporter permease n=1 Tax=Rhodovulum sp. DZ06 TaxID=3425126 RepID=UPI003D353F08
MNAQLPRWVDLGLIPLLNLVAAFLVAGLVVLIIGEDPIKAVEVIVWGALGWGEGIGFTLFYATNFIFTGLAVAIAFHAGLFNIGGEGQAYIGGLGVAIACLALDTALPWWLIAPIAAVMGGAFGAGWALIPAYLQAKRGSHIVITTIMFNFIGASLMAYLLVNVMKVEGAMAPESRTFEEAGRLPKLDGFMSLFGQDIGGAPLNVSFFLAIAACIFCWALIWRTKLGYEIRTFGANPTAANYAGISATKIIVVAMCISGALAGMMALNPVMGDQNRLFLDVAGGAGFVGIAVALMGRAHPLGVALAALLFGVLYQGGAELAFEMPTITRDMVVVIQGLVVLFAGALEFMFRPAVARLFAMGKTEAA